MRTSRLRASEAGIEANPGKTYSIFSRITFQKDEPLPTTNYKYEKRQKELEKKKKKAEKEKRKEIKKNNQSIETPPPTPEK